MKYYLIKYKILILLLSLCIQGNAQERIYSLVKNMKLKDAYHFKSKNPHGINVTTAATGDWEVNVTVKSKEKFNWRFGPVCNQWSDPVAIYLYRAKVTSNTNGILESFPDGSLDYYPPGYTCYYYKNAPSNDLKVIKYNALLIDYVKYGAKRFWPFGADNADVDITITLTGNVKVSDIIEIIIPGVESIDPTTDFDNLRVKGINFTVRPPASDAELITDQIPFNDGYSKNIKIMTSHLPSNISSEIAVPRKINADVMAGLPGSFTNRNNESFSTNMVVYPKGGAFRVVATQNISPLSMMHVIDDPSVVLTIAQKEVIFDALVNGVETAFYIFEIGGTNNNRVAISNINENGPFPYTSFGDIIIDPPKETATNRKMRYKNQMADHNKFLIAWHRGFWRDAPENTLQSIEAAKIRLPSSDMLELDISRTSSLTDGIYDYVMYHDPFMFRESSTGPNKVEDKCINPYDKILVESSLLSLANRQNLRTTLKERFPGYSEADYDNWIKGPNDFTLSELQQMTVRDRFGCLTGVQIPSLNEGIQKAKMINLPIMVDKGMDDIDNIYWHAILFDYESEVFFKGQADSRDPVKLTKMYGDELFKQIVYTPYYFDNVAQKQENYVNGKLKHLEDFIDKETNNQWIIPGFELQIKVSKQEAIDGGVAKGFSPDGVQRLLDFNAKYRETKWMGITQINPTAYNGFDNKIIFMDATDDAKMSNPYSSRHDRRADLMFNINDIKCDYWTTDRPDAIVEFLVQIGLMNPN